MIMNISVCEKRNDSKYIKSGVFKCFRVTHKLYSDESMCIYKFVSACAHLKRSKFSEYEIGSCKA